MFSWWLSGYITRTLKDVIQFTENVAIGEFDNYISTQDGAMPIELEKLIESINQLIEWSIK